MTEGQAAKVLRAAKGQSPGYVKVAKASNGLFVATARPPSMPWLAGASPGRPG